MSDERSTPQGSVQFLLGEIGADVRSIKTGMDRITFRLDNLEVRTEKLEAASSRQGMWSTFVEKAVWLVVGAVIAASLKLINL